MPNAGAGSASTEPALGGADQRPLAEPSALAALCPPSEMRSVSAMKMPEITKTRWIAADHITTARLALAQLPKRYGRGRQTLICSDSAGLSSTATY